MKNHSLLPAGYILTWILLALAGCAPAGGLAGAVSSSDTPFQAPSMTDIPESTRTPTSVPTSTSTPPLRLSITPKPTRPGNPATKTVTETPSPTRELAYTAVSVAAGGSHTCVVTDAGGVKCWGKNEHGELGNGTWTDSSVLVDVAGLNHGVKTVAAGWGHTCAMTLSGGVKCWGENRNGELGNGANENSSTPVDVIGLKSGATYLEAGDNHTCVVLADGSVRCWGFNLYGQLGDGTAVDRNIPVEVERLTDESVAVVAGWGHTCALSAAGGARCWGNNHYGQLGSGSGVENQHTPVSVAGLSNGVTSISADGAQTCALMAKGLVMCWGNNKYGQLGDGTSEIRNVPAVVVGLNFSPISIAVGWNHSCAVGDTGLLVCWGWNYYGQSGNGNRTSSTRPVDSLMNNTSGIALGWGHTCAVGIPFGVVQCCGWNESGQLGDRSIADSFQWVYVYRLVGR